jgi:hypothetical protein
MSDQITTAFVQQYKGTLYNLVQQKGSRLREAVTVEAVNGEFGYFDQIGATAAIERTSRHSDSPLVNTPHARRQVTMRDFEWGDLIDNPDKVRLLVDPSSSYLQSAMWALGRKVDDIVVEAALGTAKTGKTGGTTVALPSAQKLAVASSGLTLAKLLSAKEILDSKEADPDDPRFMAVTAKQVSNLLNTTEVKSSDYNTVKALAQGELDSFLGFRFIRTERLTTDGSGNRQVIAWTKSGLLLALGSDVKGRVIERPDKSFSVYAYASLSCGATRMEEEKVVEIACQES